MPVPDLTDLSRIRDLAIPLSWVGTRPDPTPILELLDAPDVVGIGEPTHGDAETIRLKHALTVALAATRTKTLLAWERSVGNMRLIAAVLANEQEVPSSARRWLYPWVYEEVDELLQIVGPQDMTGAEVILGGVDVDGPPPGVVLEEAIARVSKEHAAPLKEVQRSTTDPRDPPTDTNWYESVSKGLHQLLATDTVLGAEDRLLVEATQMWLEFRWLTLLDRSADSAFLHREKSMARNLLRQRSIHAPNLTIFSGHNGHICTDPPMAGWHLDRTPTIKYQTVGVAFRSGSFVAGTALEAGGFDRRLRLIEAELPPSGSLEDLLSGVGMSSFVLDLRSLRGTDHRLARPMTVREAGLAGGTPQFYSSRTPADVYDILVWIDAVNPATILREAGDFW